jgi:hypothetical protein
VSAPPTSERPADLVTVRIIGLPVALHARAGEHGEELRREFVLIAEQLRHADEPPSLPRRLVDLIAVLEHRYSGFTVEQEDVLERAIARGEQTMDITFRVPPDVAEAAVTLGAMLDAADAYCREGRHLLTLATPPDLVAYRRWYLQEFVDQIAGRPPTPWPGPSPSAARAPGASSGTAPGPRSEIPRDDVEPLDGELDR